MPLGPYFAAEVAESARNTSRRGTVFKNACPDFGTLEKAQALGDYEALAARERRILRLDLPTPKAVTLLVNELK